MKEKIKVLRLNVTASAILSIIIGALLLIYPETSIAAIGTVIAIIVILAGALVIIGQIIEHSANVLGIVVGVVIALVGLWMLVNPAAIMTIIPIAIGVMLVVHGIQDMAMAIEGTKAHMDRAWIPYILAVLNIILGIVCIANAFGVVSLAFRLIGVMLIWDGITDLGIVHKVKGATKDVVDATIISEEDI